jgi:hypothetical protein
MGRSFGTALPDRDGLAASAFVAAADAEALRSDIGAESGFAPLAREAGCEDAAPANGASPRTPPAAAAADVPGFLFDMGASPSSELGSESPDLSVTAVSAGDTAATDAPTLGGTALPALTRLGAGES